MTKEEKQQYVDLQYLDLFFNILYPKASLEQRAIITQMVRNREIRIDAMFENVIVALNPNIGSMPIEGMDFTDGSDAKKTMISDNGSLKKPNYACVVGNVTTKFGTLRVIAYDYIQNKFYFFLIPFEYYKGIKNKIRIPFDNVTGEPTRSNHWWKHEVTSLQALADHIDCEIEIAKNITLRANQKPDPIVKLAYLNKFKEYINI